MKKSALALMLVIASTAPAFANKQLTPQETSLMVGKVYAAVAICDWSFKSERRKVIFNAIRGQAVQHAPADYFQGLDQAVTLANSKGSAEACSALIAEYQDQILFQKSFDIEGLKPAN